MPAPKVPPGACHIPMLLAYADGCAGVAAGARRLAALLERRLDLGRDGANRSGTQSFANSRERHGDMRLVACGTAGNRSCVGAVDPLECLEARGASRGQSASGAEDL